MSFTRRFKAALSIDIACVVAHLIARPDKGVSISGKQATGRKEGSSKAVVLNVQNALAKNQPIIPGMVNSALNHLTVFLKKLVQRNQLALVGFGQQYR